MNATELQIAALLDELQQKYPADLSEKVASDVCFQFLDATGELRVLNDDEEEIAAQVIDAWRDNEDADLFGTVGDVLRKCIAERREDMEQLALCKPYSFILVDEDKETLAELFLVDEEDMIVDSGALMEGLDDELNEFLTNLLKE